MKYISLLWAHFFFIGFFPLFPGTIASLVIALIYYYLLQGVSPLFIFLLIAIVFFTGIPASSYAEKYQGRKDPRSVVIDEVAGQLVALVFSKGLTQVFLAFILFRFFDAIKPFPVRQAEKIRGGFGIMLDDIIAGLYALVLVSVYRFFS
ncbi:MAG: phosphatidylglycerophosphatase A [Candidatus Aminicenantes bacterium]|nr:phosphatidylglycerophosphatase A [Candidatus Aminicenantes bacterium]